MFAKFDLTRHIRASFGPFAALQVHKFQDVRLSEPKNGIRIPKADTALVSPTETINCSIFAKLKKGVAEMRVNFASRL